MDDLAARIASCRACPRLVAWREQVSREKRAAFSAEEYWGRPVPGFGDPAARLLVVGLAPAAHGANRTGRMFTGDRSGDWLFRALHRAGYANQRRATHRGDGLRLTDCWVTAAGRCAPPGNAPTPGERDACRHWLEEEFDRLTAVRVVVCLGGLAWTGMHRLLADRGGGGPPQPAEHVHRAAHRGHVRHGLCRGAAPRRRSWVGPAPPIPCAVVEPRFSSRCSPSTKRHTSAWRQPSAKGRGSVRSPVGRRSQHSRCLRSARRTGVTCIPGSISASLGYRSRRGIPSPPSSSLAPPPARSTWTVTPSRPFPATGARGGP